MRLPRISNFSDFDPFEQNTGVSLIYTTDTERLSEADLIIIPGSKSTISDMEFMRKKGIADTLCKLSRNTPIIGICGGFQMLGELISDPTGEEGGGEIRGLGLLPAETVLQEEKRQTRTEGMIDDNVAGIFSPLSGKHFSGYEIHMGATSLHNSIPTSGDALSSAEAPESLISTEDNIYGTYIHGIFDEAEITCTILQALADKKGVTLDLSDQKDQRLLREEEYDRLADTLRRHLDLTRIL